VTGLRGGRSRALRSPALTEPGPPIDELRLPNGRPPDWVAVEELVEFLAKTHAVFATSTSRTNWISSYEPGRRIMLESDGWSGWVQIEHLQACWETFERLGRIKRRDVLEPGRCSALVMALFAQVKGVQRRPGKEPALVLPRAASRAAR
jgi:hypothetical protein